MLEKIKSADDMLIEKVAVLHRPFLNSLMRFLTFLGDYGKIWVVVWLSVSLYKRSVYVLISIFFSVFFAFINSEVIIKRIVGRVRPCHKIDEEDLILKKIPKYFSFPSSHSASSFAMLTMVMIHCGAAVSIVVFILALGISFSRFYLQAHYLTDVVCGILIGITFSFAMYKVIEAIFMAVNPALIK